MKERNLINDKINSASVMLITLEEKDIITLSSAIKMAKEIKQDVVQVGKHEEIPVVKIMDYGKFVFDQKKKSKINSKVGSISRKSTKEVFFRPCTGDSDIETKKRAITNFLSKGHDVKIGMKFKGRELAHKNLGRTILDEIRQSLIFYKAGKVKSDVSDEGKRLILTLTPN